MSTFASRSVPPRRYASSGVSGTFSPPSTIWRMSELRAGPFSARRLWQLLPAHYQTYNRRLANPVAPRLLAVRFSAVPRGHRPSAKRRAAESFERQRRQREVRPCSFLTSEVVSPPRLVEKF